MKSSLASKLDVSEVDSLASFLTRTRLDEPHFVYIAPDQSDRVNMLSWFFRSVAIPASLHYGEVSRMLTANAAALWIAPGRRITFNRWLRSSISAMNKHFAPDVFTRFLDLIMETERVRFRLAARWHWYLASAGIDHPRNTNAIGRALLEPLLCRADIERVPCYVEVFHETLLPFYRSLGFQIEGAGNISQNGPSFWALIRPPQ